MTIVEKGDHVTCASAVQSAQAQWRRDFLCTLFALLDDTKVRYCVLHSWEELPDRLSSDLDIAVHPEDAPRVGTALRAMSERAYRPNQIIHYAVASYGFRFLCVETPYTRSIAVDIIFRYQRGFMISPPAERLVAGRRRQGIFWIPSPEAEFSYLLAKKSWKGSVSVQQLCRLEALIGQLGRPKAEQLAGELFLGRLNVKVVEASANGQLNALLSRAQAHCWKALVVRRPFRAAAILLLNGTRLIRRWLHPTGLFVAVLGPDGVGKSSVITHLVEAVSPAFDRQRRFHWRPMLLWRRTRTRDTTRPHGVPPRGQGRSAATLCAHITDYWLGYWLMIRPILARSGFVIFDRYYDDVQIDPQRYRYGGPLWLLGLLKPLVPKPDVILILDAPEEVVLSRKQEVEPQELRRQRQRYTAYCSRGANTYLINSTSSIADVTSVAANVVMECLTQRSERRYARWLSGGKP